MKKNDILVILVPLFIFVLAWVSFSIYHNIVTSTISQPLSVQITPITPSFDTSTIGNLKNRIKVTPVYSLSTATQITTSLTPSPALPSTSTNSIILAPITPSPTPAVIKQATAEGSLTQ